ncbi:MAG: hypothetical protein HC876_03180 [Chloroflexaceae bacterium]|nr:hypothetical protein [Chloroflexaceae bacterium]NJO04600.1 hypothetical protein [Chloroflexaceae bacterium]
MLYRNARAVIEQEAEERLGRALTRHEQNLFRNCGTLSKLEELGMNVYYADSPDDLALQLGKISLDGRFRLAVEELLPRLERLVHRTLNQRERQKIYSLENIEMLWSLEQRVFDAPANLRDAALMSFLQTKQLQNDPAVR